MMRNSKGQILLPGLALFLLLMAGFMGLVVWGQNCLTHMRMEMAAQATALSVARAEAAMLINRAWFNTTINRFFIVQHNGEATMDVLSLARYEIEHLARLTLLRQNAGIQGQYIALGHVVARANGADRSIPTPDRLDLRLRMQSIHHCVIIDGTEPPPVKRLEDAYFVRTWEPSRERAQPPHRTTWKVLKGPFIASATARVYLDLRQGAYHHNGGFPREHEGWNAWTFKSYYPQFNAKLVQS